MKPKHPLLSSYHGKKLTFKGDTWTVKIVKEIQSDHEDIKGVCDWDTQEIQIQRGIGRDLTHHVLWHEIIHIIEWYYRFDLNHEHVDKIGEGLKDLFSSNKNALKEFFK